MNAVETRERLRALLGLRAKRASISGAKVLGETVTSHYALTELELTFAEHEPIPALMTVPTRGQAPFPAVLFSHSHGGYYFLGKRELVEGNVYMAKPPYAEALALRGFASLCIDQVNFGERHRRSEDSLFKELLWQGEVLFGHMVDDALLALDYLVTRNDIDPQRIAALGMSMGSTLSFWTAALDERVAAVVELCCLTDYRELVQAQGLDGHGIYYYVPGLLKAFETQDILELIAPRPFLSLAGDLDPLTPVRGLDKLDAALKATYAKLGRPEAWRMLREEHGHEESPLMRTAALDWLSRWLTPQAGRAGSSPAR